MTRRVVVITGAGGALGSAISRQLASEPDTDLVLSDVDAASLDATVSGLSKTEGAVETVLADVSDFEQVEAVVAKAIDSYGHLDVLISNAGVLSPNGRIHNLSTEDWERAFRVNVLGAVNGIRAAVAPMRVQTSGSIVLTPGILESALLTVIGQAAQFMLGTESTTDFCAAAAGSAMPAVASASTARIVLTFMASNS